MNFPLEITLTTVHLGSARRVVTLGFAGKDLAGDFLTKLKKSNKSGFNGLRVRFAVVSESKHFTNPHAFKDLGDGLYEFKKDGLRLYAFLEDDPKFSPTLIIAANGGTKNTKKEQISDISRARKLKAQYEQAKTCTEIELIPLPDENQDI